MKKQFSFLLVCLFISGCSSLVNIDYDKNTDFNAFKSFKVKETSENISADTRINSKFMQQRMANELKESFIQKNYIFSEKNADIEVKYHLQIKTEIEFQEPRFSIGIGSYSRHSAVGFGFNVPASETNNTDSLVLTVDIYSLKTNQLIWRGIRDRILPYGATPEIYTKMVKELIAEILKEFPPK